MKLTILGATGATGRHIVRHALADGLEAMTATGVRRIVVLSAGALNRTGAGSSVFVRLAGLGATPARADGPHERPGAGGGGACPQRISRADVGRAMLDAVTDPNTFGHAVGVSSFWCRGGWF